MKDNNGYPRDMVGYGRTPPFADRPNNARLGVQERGLLNDADAETRTAFAEIDRIAALRLKDILP